jgi:hypothetical protein
MPEAVLTVYQAACGLTVLALGILAVLAGWLED